VNQRSFASQSVANALGTLCAAAVIYVVGVIAGALPAEIILFLASLLAIMIAALVTFYHGKKRSARGREVTGRHAKR
jgi:type III secretory pathway component EscV